MMTIRRFAAAAQPTTLMASRSVAGHVVIYKIFSTYSFNIRFAATLSCRAGLLSLIGMLKASGQDINILLTEFHLALHAYSYNLCNQANVQMELARINATIGILSFLNPLASGPATMP